MSVDTTKWGNSVTFRPRAVSLYVLEDVVHDGMDSTTNTEMPGRSVFSLGSPQQAYRVSV